MKQLLIIASLCIVLVAQQDVVGSGKGITKKGIITRAACDAMQKYLQQNLRNFPQHQAIINKHVQKNWRKYWMKNIAVKKQSQGVYKIKMRIDSNALLRDINNIPAIRLKQKAQRLQKIAIVLDPQFESSSFADVKVMMDYLYDQLGQHFAILDKASSHKLFSLEKNMFASKEHNYSNQLWREFDEVRVMMYFSITRQQNQVSIRTRATHRMTAAQWFRFSRSTSHVNTEQAISMCCEKVTSDIVKKVARRHTILPEDVYYLKFVLLAKNSDVQKVRTALISLKNDKMLDILDGGIGAGKSYIEERIRWRKTAFSQLEIIGAIQEYCASEGLQVNCEKYSHNLIVFQPPKTGVSKAPKKITTTLCESVVHPSEWDHYLQLESHAQNVDEGENIITQFRWPQHAPQDWYFYSLYFAEDAIYLVYPNAQHNNTLLQPNKNYSFPDSEFDLDVWGIELKAHVPAFNNKSKAQLLLLATSTPISFLRKKLAKLTTQNIVTLKASEIGQIRDEVLQKQYAHQIANIEIGKKQYQKFSLLRKRLKQNKEQNPFAVAMTTNKNTTYHKGDFLEINWISSANSYVYIFYRQANGNILRIFPNKYDANGYIQKNTVYTLPNKKYEFDLEIDPKTGSGIEQIEIHTSQTPLQAIFGNNLEYGIIQVQESDIRKLKSQAQDSCQIFIEDTK